MISSDRNPIHISEGDRNPKAKHVEAREYTCNTYSRFKQTSSCAQLASTLSSQPGNLAPAWPDPPAPSPFSSPELLTPPTNEVAEHSSIWLLNIQSFNPSVHSTSKWKLSYLKDCLNKERANYHVVPFVALTETWLKSYIDDAQLDIPGYNLYQCDRGAGVGGGVLLYCHEQLPISAVQTFIDKYCQALMCCCESQKTFICVLYRPTHCPTSSFKGLLGFLYKYITKYDENYQLSILGDFNFPRINWPLNSVFPGGSVSSGESASLLLDFMSDNLCTQHILEPTRMDNVLDLYISNAEDLISHISTSETPLSDHKHVEVFLCYNPCSLTSPTLPDFSESSFRNLDFNKTDFKELNVILRIIDWEALSSICKEEEFPQLFTLILLQMCELYCPRKVSPRVQSASSTRIYSRKKRKLARQLVEAKSSANCPQARIDSLRRKVALAHFDIRDAINEDLQYHEQQAVSKVKENPKFFYSFAKKFSKKKKQYHHVI